MAPMRRLTLVVAGVLALTILHAATERAVQRRADAADATAKPQGDKPQAAPCLAAPLPWSARPKLEAGLQIIHSWFIRFETPDGARTIPARIFLIERRAAPSRILCIGHEIQAAADFEPDFEIESGRVSALSPCLFVVKLGDLQTSMIRTTAP